MKWDESLEIGIPAIDAQHQALFRQVDSLLDRSKADRVSETLTFLAKYVLAHFGDEEIMQRISKYPNASKHKKMHDDFVAALTKLEKEYDSSDDDMLILMKIGKFSVDWLKNHIGEEDKDFANYFKASGFASSQSAPNMPINAPCRVLIASGYIGRVLSFAALYAVFDRRCMIWLHHIRPLPLPMNLSDVHYPELL